MKKIATILILLPMLLWAAVPDETMIVAQIDDSQSKYYYPNLMARFEMGDTTLTEGDYHYLYYGYAYQQEYKPLSVNHSMDRLLTLASGLELDNPIVGQLEDIIIAGREALKLDPFNPQIWNLMAYAYGGIGAKQREREAYDRVEKILSAIDSSGGGVDKGDAKHILMFTHASDLLSSKGLNPQKARVISRTVEFMPILEPIDVDGKRVRGYYFDFGRIYWNKPDSVTYKRDRTWQFNNLKPREYR
ncbi:MAG: DUF4919 domain-containing protein [Rikenellaceae bacterium]